MRELRGGASFQCVEFEGGKISVHGNPKIPPPPGYQLIMTAPLVKSLRILAMYEAKTAKNSNFWMFWTITLLICHLRPECTEVADFAVFCLIRR